MAIPIAQPNDGGPAFPRSSQGPSGDLDMTFGMSLRDWFAGTLPLSDFDNLLIELFRKDGIKTVDEVIEYAAALRFRNADAMLAESDKNP